MSWQIVLKIKRRDDREAGWCESSAANANFKSYYEKFKNLVVWIQIAFICIIYTVMYFKLRYPVG